MTYDDIVSVVGFVDDDLVAMLVASGASLNELREAWSWLNNDEALMGEGRPLPGTCVGQLIDLLEPDDDGGG